MKSASSKEDEDPRLRASTMAIIGLLSLFHAIVFVWAAQTLPWQLWSTFSGASYVLAALHAVSALTALLTRVGKVVPSSVRQPLHRAWLKVFRWSCWVSLAHAIWFGVTLFLAGKYIADLYGGLGQGVAIALVVAMSAYFWLCIPFALWGLVKTTKWKNTNPRPFSTKVAISASFVGVAFFASIVEPSTPAPVVRVGANADKENTVEQIEREEVFSKLQQSIPIRGSVLSPENWKPVVDQGPLTCQLPIDEHRATVIVAHHLKRVCLQGGWSRVLDELKQYWNQIDDGEFVKIDVIVASQPMSVGVAWLDRLWVRPGQDGICIANECLMPWQLVARGQFSASRPIPAIHDLRIGVDPMRLRARFKSGRSHRTAAQTPAWWPRSWASLAWQEDPWTGMHRVDTLSYVVDGDHRLSTFPPHPNETKLDQETWQRSMRKSETFIARAQHERGKFRYRLDPYKGKSDTSSMSLARQAGTTLAWCELAEGNLAESRKTIAQKALRALIDFEVDIGIEQGGALTSRPRNHRLRLGDSALPLIALLACRDLVGEQYDGVIARLGNFLLGMQRPDGGFYPAWNRQTNSGQVGPEPLYAVGQAIFALSLLEKLASEETPKLGMDESQVHVAVERAMDYVSGPYWNHAGRSFFFVEENWNCLAARASLGHHRHSKYEQFCLDYVQFKSRLLLDESSEVKPDFLGAYGFGNVIPPHQTPAAGLTEALAAAAAIKLARGQSITAEKNRIAKVLHFLLRQQWTTKTCFACSSAKSVDGGFSESMVSPTIRIDYVQHAWAAMGHGGKILGYSRSNSKPETRTDV